MNKSFLGKIVMITTAILLISITSLSWLFDHNLLKFFTSEISNSISDRLVVVETLHDNVERELRNDMFYLTGSAELNLLASNDSYSRVVSDVAMISNVSRLSNMMKQLKESNQMIHSIFIYPQDSDYYISENGLKGKHTINEATNYLEQITSDFLSPAKQAEQFKVYPDEIKGVRVLAYVYAVSPYLYYGKGVVVIHLLESELYGFLDGMGNPTGNTHISMIDQSGTVLLDYNKDSFGNQAHDADVLAILNGTNSSGYLTRELNKEKQLLIYNRSVKSGWVYVANYPASELYKRLSSFRANVLIISALVTLIGVLLSIILTRRTYTPIQMLINTIKSRNFREKGTDTELLTNAFNSLIKSESDLKKRIENNELTDKDQFLFNLLSREFEITFIPDFLPINMQYQSICMLIDDYQRFTDDLNRDAQFYNKSLILQIFEQMKDAGSNFYGVVMHENMIGLIHACKHLDEGNLDFVLKTLQAEISRAIFHTVSIGIGMPYTDLQYAHESFSQAKIAARRRFFIGKDSRIHYDESFSREGTYRYPVLEEKHLINNVLAGNKEKALESIYYFFDNMNSAKSQSVDNVLHMSTNLITNLWTAIDGETGYSYVKTNLSVFLTNLLLQENLSEVKRMIGDCLMSLIDSKQQTSAGIHITDLIEYIDKHYKSDININSIADQVNLSYSHVRKLFKDQTGKTIVEYINQLRIQEGKRLLLGSNASVLDIALAVGHYNEQSFFRLFKKQEGITPGEFRKRKAVSADQVFSE